MLSALVRYSLLTGLFIGLFGCVAGNDVKVEAYRNTTVGQELIDLEKAREKGLINPSEYEALREEIKKGGPINVEIDKQ